MPRRVVPVRVGREDQLGWVRECDRVVAVPAHHLTPPAPVTAQAPAPAAAIANALHNHQPPRAPCQKVRSQPLRRLVPIGAVVTGAPRGLIWLVEQVGRHHVGRAAVPVGQGRPRVEQGRLVGRGTPAVGSLAAPHSRVGVVVAVHVEHHQDPRRLQPGDQVVQRGEAPQAVVLWSARSVEHRVGGNVAHRKREAHCVESVVLEEGDVTVDAVRRVAPRVPELIHARSSALEAEPAGSFKQKLLPP
mmetsp:Transcript_28940/g.93453  ORF Transcript_28940/g.93453 Transcript_28940/m.93453 type:complete len:246 (+) Transcript_28940:461-1198(+)|eukprot:scaffold19704_cov112-Isochrysis_galbana.AAC.1